MLATLSQSNRGSGWCQRCAMWQSPVGETYFGASPPQRCKYEGRRRLRRRPAGSFIFPGAKGFGEVGLLGRLGEVRAVGIDWLALRALLSGIDANSICHDYAVLGLLKPQNTGTSHNGRSEPSSQWMEIGTYAASRCVTSIIRIQESASAGAAGQVAYLRAFLLALHCSYKYDAKHRRQEDISLPPLVIPIDPKPCRS